MSLIKILHDEPTPTLRRPSDEDDLVVRVRHMSSGGPIDVSIWFELEAGCCLRIVDLVAGGPQTQEVISSKSATMTVKRREGPATATARIRRTAEAHINPTPVAYSAQIGDVRTVNRSAGINTP